MYEFKLPDVGEGIHEAEILRWLVKVGEKVARDQPMLEIQTDKAVVEIPAPVAGAIAEIRAREGTLAHVGEVLVVIEPGNGQATSKTAPALNVSQDGQAARLSESPAFGIAGPGQRVLAAPAVRKLALELGGDLSQVSGSGPAGGCCPPMCASLWSSKAKPNPSAWPKLKPRQYTPTPPPLRFKGGQAINLLK
ncbi:MAG: biotin/lipoyl-containing protein [Anaerolineae bacterium]